jgi:hypothetical protein
VISKTSSSIPTNLAEWTSAFSTIDPQILAQQTRVDVLGFMEKISVEPDQTLLLVGRKAGLLFQPYLEKLANQRISKALKTPFEPDVTPDMVHSYRFIQSPALIRRLNGAFWTTGTISKKVNLLADCINTGEEISTVYKGVSRRGITVNKIYSYASNGQTVKNLSTDPDLKNTEIVSRHLLEPEDAKHFFRRVQGYYQSLLEPVNSDHAYNVYHSRFNLLPKTIKKVVEEVTQWAFGDKALHFEKDEDAIYLPRSMTSQTIELETVNHENVNFGTNIQDFLTLVEFECKFIRLKTASTKINTDFSIVVGFSAHPIDFDNLRKENKCDLLAKSKCYANLVKSNMALSEIREILCPLCFNNYVERSILNRFSSHILSIIANGAWQTVTVEKHDPIERSL